MSEGEEETAEETQEEGGKPERSAVEEDDRTQLRRTNYVGEEVEEDDLSWAEEMEQSIENEKDQQINIMQDGSAHNNKLYVDLLINWKSVRFQVDTGAPVTIVSKKTALEVLDIKYIRKTDKHFTDYGGNRIPMFGFKNGVIGIRRKRVEDEIYVTDRMDGNNLLGQATMQKLGLTFKIQAIMDGERLNENKCHLRKKDLLREEDIYVRIAPKDPKLTLEKFAVVSTTHRRAIWRSL